MDRTWQRYGNRLGRVSRLLIALAMACMGSVTAQQPARIVAADSPSANATVIATGLNGPRGLKFGPDGNLYVAEAGTGGKTSTVGMCEQVAGPVGPYSGGKTARISRIATDGTRTTVVDGLPSAISSLPSGDTEGAADVAFIGTTLYALVAGGGCSHGVPDVPAGVIRVNADGTWTLVADYSAYTMAHPVQSPPMDDFEPDGTPYGMLVGDGTLYVTEANHTELTRIAPDGTITRVVEQSAEPWEGFTGLAFAGGNLYTGSLTEFPVKQGAAKIWKITPGGQVITVAHGLTAVVSVALDNLGQLYALEFSTQDNAMPTPGTGEVVRVTSSGELETIASGLSVPTAMTFGPDGNLYVSNFGAAPPGAGQIVRIAVAPPAFAPASAPTALHIGDGARSAVIRRLGEG